MFWSQRTRAGKKAKAEGSEHGRQEMLPQGDLQGTSPELWPGTAAGRSSQLAAEAAHMHWFTLALNCPGKTGIGEFIFCYSQQQLWAPVKPRFSFAQPSERKPWFMRTSACYSQPGRCQRWWHWRWSMSTLLPLSWALQPRVAFTRNVQSWAEVSLSIQERCSQPPTTYLLHWLGWMLQ